ncbi:transposase, partial [Desulfobulbus sp. F5]|nr:transposase [Desulfobulbus sp. F5]
WKVERLFAWLQNFRRLVVRYERHLGNFLAFLQLACSVILLRFILKVLFTTNFFFAINPVKISFTGLLKAKKTLCLTKG